MPVKKHVFYDYNDLCDHVKNKYAAERAYYAPSHKKFWDFMLNDVLRDYPANGSVRLLNWGDILEHNAEEPWQKEIVSLFVAEFGTHDMYVRFDW